MLSEKGTSVRPESEARGGPTSLRRRRLRSAAGARQNRLDDRSGTQEGSCPSVSP